MRLKRLVALNLSANMLEGHIPRELGGLRSLQGVSLASNRLTGAIPREIDDLALLQMLDVSSNRLEGELPLSVLRLKAKGRADFSNNASFTLPPSLGELGADVVELDLSHCKIAGRIPPGVGRLVGLQKLLLYNNRPRGAIRARSAT